MLVQGKLRRTGLCSINDHDTNYRLINKDTPKNLLLELRVWGRGQKEGVWGYVRIVGTWGMVVVSLIPALVRQKQVDV